MLGIEWLHETFRRAVDAESEGRVPKLPEREGYLRLRQSEASSGPAKRRRTSETEDDLQPLDPEVRFSDIPRYACQRVCPLVCVNQDIVSLILARWDPIPHTAAPAVK